MTKNSKQIGKRNDMVLLSRKNKKLLIFSLFNFTSAYFFASRALSKLDDHKSVHLL